MTLANGKTVQTCCPRCGLHYLNINHQTAKTLQATDYTSGQWIDATKALYVSGSDVSHCGMVDVHRDAYGCCAIKDYDRCLPSLIAFVTLDAAQAFQKQHGGSLVTFAQLQADQPLMVQ